MGALTPPPHPAAKARPSGNFDQPTFEENVLRHGLKRARSMDPQFGGDVDYEFPVESKGKPSKLQASAVRRAELKEVMDLTNENTLLKDSVMKDSKQ